MSSLRALASRATDALPDLAVAVASYHLDLRRRERAAGLGYDSPLVTWSDDWLTYSFARSGSYELTQKHFIATALLTAVDHEATAIDVGANVGTYSVFLGKFFTEVLAFEPSPQLCRLLRLTLELSEISNVSLKQAALGSESGERLLASPRQAIPNRGMGRIVKATEPTLGEEAAVSVTLARGDDFVREDTPVAFIKVDVEGAEAEVLRGFNATITRDTPALAVETLSLQAATQVASVLPDCYSGYGLRRSRRVRTLVPVSDLSDFASVDLTYFLPRVVGDRLVGTKVPELG